MIIKTPENPMRQVMFRIPKETRHRLKVAAAKKGLTVQEFCANAVDDFLQKVAADEQTAMV